MIAIVKVGYRVALAFAAEHAEKALAIFPYAQRVKQEGYETNAPWVPDSEEIEINFVPESRVTSFASNQDKELIDALMKKTEECSKADSRIYKLEQELRKFKATAEQVANTLCPATENEEDLL